jgi:uncharacterized Zn-finger protein
MKSVHGDRMYNCNTCDKSFKTSRALSEHIGIVHKSSEVIYSCPKCVKSFDMELKLRQHMKVVHSDRVSNVTLVTKVTKPMATCQGT